MLAYTAGEPAGRPWSAPGRTRTCDLEIRRLLLYPSELRARRAPAYLSGLSAVDRLRWPRRVTRRRFRCPAGRPDPGRPAGLHRGLSAAGRRCLIVAVVAFGLVGLVGGVVISLSAERRDRRQLVDRLRADPAAAAVVRLLVAGPVRAGASALQDRGIRLGRRRGGRRSPWRWRSGSPASSTSATRPWPPSSHPGRGAGQVPVPGLHLSAGAPCDRRHAGRADLRRAGRHRLRLRREHRLLRRHLPRIS